MSNISKYILMTALVCLSAAIAFWTFDIFLMQTIKETRIERAADRYLEEVAEYAAENSEAITEYAKRELKLRQERNARCYEQVNFNESDGALAFFDYGWVSYSEPRHESEVLFIHCSHCCYYTVTYTEMPLNFKEFFMELVADNIYLDHTMNTHEMMQEINS